MGSYKIAFTLVLEVVYLFGLTTKMQKNRVLQDMSIIGRKGYFVLVINTQVARVYFLRITCLLFNGVIEHWYKIDQVRVF